MKTIGLESISLEAAQDIAQQSLAYARNQGMAPIAVAVLDVRGALKAFLAEDGTTLLRFDIAFGKAWGALSMGHGGRSLVKRSTNTPLFFNALQSMADGKMVPVPGSVLIRNTGGEIVGAVGISGESSENDERCAVFGVQEVGLTPDTGI